MADRYIKIEELTEKAVRAMLRVIDSETAGTTNACGSPCGDKLAFDVHERIKVALREHFRSEFAPIEIKASDLDD